MKIVQNITDSVRNGLRSFLQIEPATTATFNVQETLDFESNVYKNQIWYRGDSDELSQLYSMMPGISNKTRFWAAVATQGREIRKIHTGLPAMMIDVLVSLTLADMNEIVVSEKYADLWRQIAEKNNFSDLLERAVTEALVTGDGAFKISTDPSLSEYPILEFYPADKVVYHYRRGILIEVEFLTDYGNWQRQSKDRLTLHEHYGKGYVNYELYRGDKQIPLDSFPETKELEPVTYDNSFMMAVPLKFYQSNKWKGRGKPLLDNKSDAFDAFDEAWSQWMDAVRQGRATKYIPTNMIPRNPENGQLLKPNPFDNAYIEHEQPMTEGAAPRIEVVQPSIPVDSYLQTYITALDQCLQGVISPSTLGIDVKKLDNAEAQREKEKTTLYTRNRVVDTLQDVLPELIENTLKVQLTASGQALENIDVDVPFGEYANPSFESQVETVSKARSGGIMSVEAAVEELYGDTRDQDWKKEEVERLKAEQGIAQIDELSVGEDSQPIFESTVTGSLNGAQIGSLMNIIRMVKDGSVTRTEAISIIVTTLGISKEAAESFIENTGDVI